MTRWADVLHSRTPTTDHRWLALPHDLASDLNRAEAAGRILTDQPGLGHADPVNWIVRADKSHVWFGANGYVSRLLGDEAHGIRISRGGAAGDTRPNLAFAGFAAPRGEVSSLPHPHPGQKCPALLSDLSQYYSKMWSEGRDWRFIQPTTYSERTFPLSSELPESWRGAIQEAERRIASGEQFQLNCIEGREPIFTKITHAAEELGHSGAAAARSQPGLYDQAASTRTGLSSWRSLPGRGKTLAVAGAALAAVAAGTFIYRALSYPTSDSLNGSTHSDGASGPKPFELTKGEHSGMLLPTQQLSSNQAIGGYGSR